MSTTGVTAPEGFVAAAACAGIKPSGNPDLAVVVNEGPDFTAAGVFTRNKVCAAPVKVSREAVAGGQLQAVVLNSGNANACTGQQGLNDARTMQRLTAHGVGTEPSLVAVCSTGIIGDVLPMDKVEGGIAAVVKQLGDNGGDAATAIMTTDTVAKEVVVKGDGWTLGGMGKGAGMMAPSLATMLVCLTTDAKVAPDALQAALERGCAATFDTLDIDGSTSTNDTVIAMASGASGVTPTQQELDAAVLEACAQLAAKMQSDAEGVTKRVTITVTGAADDAQALHAARTIGRDNLVKTAMFGSDPNWGRVLAAVGMAETEMDAENISVAFNGQTVCEHSTGTPGAREVDLSGADIAVVVDLGTGGEGRATVRTTDLSHAYVEINSAYTS